eukprot:4551404-Heterocapsa_arctica.AAC.1
MDAQRLATKRAKAAEATAAKVSKLEILIAESQVGLAEARALDLVAQSELKAANESLLGIHRIGASAGQGIQVDVSWDGLPEEFKLDPAIAKRMEA